LRLLLCIYLLCPLPLSVELSVPPVISVCAFWQIAEVIWMRLSYESTRFAFFILFFAIIFLVDFGFNIEELIPGISTSSLSRPTLSWMSALG
jgi:hypothetical protein